MRTLLLGCALTVTLAQVPAGPIVLTRDQIAENYYDQAPAGLAASEGWLGLYVDEQGARLQAAEVRFTAEPDGNYTIHRMTPEPVGAVLLFSGIDALSPGPAITSIEWVVSLRPEEPVVELSLGQRDYSISMEPADWCEASITLTAGGVSQVLYAPGQGELDCGEPHFDVFWAGDLDRDGELDLVTSLSPKYSAHPRQLFLSGLAAPGELVSEAAVYESYAD